MNNDYAKARASDGNPKATWNCQNLFYQNLIRELQLEKYTAITMIQLEKCIMVSWISCKEIVKSRSDEVIS